MMINHLTSIWMAIYDQPKSELSVKEFEFPLLFELIPRVGADLARLSLARPHFQQRKEICCHYTKNK